MTLARTRAKRRARRERTRAHTKVRRERRGNVSQGVAARGTVLAADDIGADPMAARLAIRINTLHSGAGHVLHVGLLRASALCTGKQRRAKFPLLA